MGIVPYTVHCALLTVLYVPCDTRDMGAHVMGVIFFLDAKSFF